MRAIVFRVVASRFFFWWVAHTKYFGLMSNTHVAICHDCYLGNHTLKGNTDNLYKSRCNKPIKSINCYYKDR